MMIGDFDYEPEGLRETIRADVAPALFPMIYIIARFPRSAPHVSVIVEDRP